MEVALNVKIYYCPQLLLVVQSYAENSMSRFCDFFVVAVVSGSRVSWYLRTHTGFVRWPYNRGFLQNKLHICWLAWKSVHFSLYGESDSSLTCNTEIRGEVEWVEEDFELAPNICMTPILISYPTEHLLFQCLQISIISQPNMLSISNRTIRAFSSQLLARL